MGLEDYSSHDALALAALVRRGEVHPTELVEAAISRIERWNGQLNAVVYKAYDQARQAAGEALPDGPFRGVPFLIKDLGCQVAGMPCTSGSRFTASEVHQEDSLLTQRYRGAGLVIVGKTNTPEFGITGTTESALLGPCRSPWNTDHISGGSSGGSASATAAGIVPMAHASDGLGSIRIPAACCGLFGMKTTRDRNPGGPNDGGRAFGFAVDHVVTRSVRDSAAMLDVTGGREPASPYPHPKQEGPYLEEVGRSPGRLRIAFSAETPSGRPIDEEIRGALQQTASLLESLGHEVEERDLGIDYRRMYKAQSAIGAASMAVSIANLTERLGREPAEDDLEPLTWASVRAGRKVTGEAVARGWQTLREANREILGVFEEIDVFVTPVMGTQPPRVGHIDPVALEPRELNRRQARAFPFTPLFNFTGQPAMSVPLFESADGLPIGIQFAGRYADEATLFRLAAQLEEERPWRNRTPAIWG